MKYLMERQDKTFCVEIPDDATIRTEWVAVASKDGKSDFLAVHVHDKGEKHIGSFAFVTAFYPEPMEPKKQDWAGVNRR